MKYDHQWAVKQTA